MYVLIDVTNGRALAKHASYRALAALHYVQFANTDAQVVPLNGTDAPFATLGPSTVADVLHNLAAYVPDALPAPAEYAEQVAHLRGLLEAAEFLRYPDEAAAAAQQQAYSLHPDEGRPAVVNLSGSDPMIVQTWPSEPQHNRKRSDSTFWINFASGEPTGRSRPKELPVQAGQRTVPKLPQRAAAAPQPNQQEHQPMATTKAVKKVVKKAATKAAPKATKAATKTAAKPAKATKASQAAEGAVEQNGIKRPKAGGKTEKVWVACDKLNEKKGTAPAFSEVNDYIDKHFASLEIPAATRRSNYACWRKFNGIVGRVTA